MPEVWIVDLAGGALEVYREPDGGRYASVARFEAGATVAPLALPDVVLEVGDVVRRRARAG